MKWTTKAGENGPTLELEFNLGESIHTLSVVKENEDWVVYIAGVWICKVPPGHNSLRKRRIFALTVLKMRGAQWAALMKQIRDAWRELSK